MELSEASKLVGRELIVEYNELLPPRPGGKPRKFARHDFRWVKIEGVDAVGMSITTLEPTSEDDGTLFIPWAAIRGVLTHWKVEE